MTSFLRRRFGWEPAELAGTEIPAVAEIPPARPVPETGPAGEEFPDDLVDPASVIDPEAAPASRFDLVKSKFIAFFVGLKEGTVNFVWERRRSYFWWHLFIWTLLMFLFSLALYLAGIETYIDALFQAISALSATGLTTIDVSTASLEVQIVIFVGMILCGAVLESTYPLAMSVEIVRQKHRRQLLWDGFSEEPPDPPPEKKAVYISLVVSYVYWLTVQVLFILPLGYYYQFSDKGAALMQEHNLNAWWFASFMGVSSFNNAGFSLLSDSIMQLATHQLALFLIAALVLLGNVAYPIALRAVFFFLHKFFAYFKFKSAAAFEFILENPRNYFTHLFGSRETWGLFWLLVLMTIGQTALLMVFSWNDPAFAHLDATATFSTMLFQSITRTAGLNTIDIGLVHTSQQLLMIVAMYISAYPVTIFLRSSNVANDEESRSLAAQSKRMFFDDLSWIVIPWYLICICEDTIDAGEGFIILFDVVSAYGTVGLSLGASGAIHFKSKIIMVVVMLMGRHRGMPDNIDGAIDMDGVAELHLLNFPAQPSPAPPPIRDEPDDDAVDFRPGDCPDPI
jgi:Trk-type K+ transport system membrane component